VLADRYTSVFVVLYYRYIQIIRLLISDDCRYLIETVEYDKNFPPDSGILLFFCPYSNIWFAVVAVRYIATQSGSSDGLSVSWNYLTCYLT